MKKILYIANVTLPTGWAHGYQITKTCEALSAFGCDVKLLITNRVDPFFTTDAYTTYLAKPIFPIHRLPVMSIAAYLPFWTEKFLFPIERWTFVQSLKKYLPSMKRVDIVYVRDAYLVEKICKITEMPVVYEMHALPTEKTLVRIKKATAVVCLTTELERIVKASCPGVITAVIPDAADTEVFDPSCTKEEARSKLGIPVDELMVAYGGQFTTMGKGKGVGALDGVVNDLQTQYPALRLYIVGGTDEDFEKVEGRSPASSSSCVGFIPREKLALYLRAADVVAMPFPNTPHYAKAMSPMKMFEYMASGTVILTSDLPSVRDVLSEETASLYLPDDMEDLAKKLVALLESEETRTKKGAAAKALVQASYTWEARAKRIAGLIERVAERARK